MVKCPHESFTFSQPKQSPHQRRHNKNNNTTKNNKNKQECLTAQKQKLVVCHTMPYQSPPAATSRKSRACCCIMTAFDQTATRITARRAHGPGDGGGGVIINTSGSKYLLVHTVCNNHTMMPRVSTPTYILHTEYIM